MQDKPPQPDLADLLQDDELAVRLDKELDELRRLGVYNDDFRAANFPMLAKLCPSPRNNERPEAAIVRHIVDLLDPAPPGRARPDLADRDQHDRGLAGRILFGEPANFRFDGRVSVKVRRTPLGSRYTVLGEIVGLTADALRRKQRRAGGRAGLGHQILIGLRDDLIRVAAERESNSATGLASETRNEVATPGRSTLRIGAGIVAVALLAGIVVANLVGHVNGDSANTRAGTPFASERTNRTGTSPIIVQPTEANAYQPPRTRYYCGTITHICQGADHVVFNSFVNNPGYDVGDERNFMTIRAAGHDSAYADSMPLRSGHRYLVRAFVDNNADASLVSESESWTARQTTVTIRVPSSVLGLDFIRGYVTAANARPPSVADTTSMSSRERMLIRVVPGSARWTSKGASNGKRLRHITTGARVGYDALDGVMPGDFHYAGYATVEIVANRPKKTP